MKDLGFDGVYINLDRRPDRRAGIEAEIARHDLAHAYRRFAAVDGNALGIKGDLLDGQKGCFASHYLLLRQNGGSGRPLHVVEDDAMFGPCTEQGLRLALESRWLDGFDLLFTDTFVLPHAEAFRTYKNLFDRAVQRDAQGKITGVNFGVADLRHKVFATTNSFLVNAASVEKLAKIYGDEIARGPELPIDLFIRKLCGDGAIRVGLIFPFITATRIEHSLQTDIGAQRDDVMEPLASDLARQSFFIGCDWRKCEDYVQKFFPILPPGQDEHGRMLAHLLAALAVHGMNK